MSDSSAAGAEFKELFVIVPVASLKSSWPTSPMSGLSVIVIADAGGVVFCTGLPGTDSSLGLLIKRSLFLLLGARGVV